MLRKDVIGNMEEKRSTGSVIRDLIPLFTVEIVILTMLNFANLSAIYRIMAIIILGIAIVPIVKSLPRDKSLIPFLLEVGGLFIYLALSVCFGYVASKSFLTILIVILGGLGFYSMGVYFGMFKNKKTQMSRILGGFYIGVGLFTIISLIVTLYGIGTPFYAIIYNKPEFASQVSIVYKARIVYDIFIDLDFTYSVPHLFGVAVLANYAILASTGIYVLLFCKIKEDRFLWYSSLFAGVSGLLTIILIPVFFALVLFLIGLGLCLILRFKNKKSWIYLIVLGSVVLVFGIIYLSFRIDRHLHYEKYANMNYFFNFIFFQNFGILKYSSNIKEMLQFKPQFVGSAVGMKDYMTSGSALIDTLYQSGILPFLALMLFLGVAIYELVRYIKRNNDNLNQKVAIIAIVAYFIICISINYVENDWSIYDTPRMPLDESFVFLCVSIFMGYMSGLNLPKKEQVEEQVVEPVAEPTVEPVEQ